MGWACGGGPDCPLTQRSYGGIGSALDRANQSMHGKDMLPLLAQFVRESNLIEGIRRDPTADEVTAHEVFLAAPKVTISLLKEFLAAVQPDARLRIQSGLDVSVGHYRPPPGGQEVGAELNRILTIVTRGLSEQEIFFAHHRYENLHPFTDGNGRSGRALWLWMMGGVSPRLFLHEWYYQSLRIELSEVRAHHNLLLY